MVQEPTGYSIRGGRTVGPGFPGSSSSSNRDIGAGKVSMFDDPLSRLVVPVPISRRLRLLLPGNRSCYFSSSDTPSGLAQPVLFQALHVVCELSWHSRNGAMSSKCVAGITPTAAMHLYVNTQQHIQYNNTLYRKHKIQA